MLGFGGGFLGKPQWALPPITDLFNGFNTDGTYTGSAQTLADYLGVNQTSPANVLPVQGGRLSYDLLEGATLGPELLTTAQQNMDSGWVVSGESTVSGGVGHVLSTDGTGSGLFVYNKQVAGKKYQYAYAVIGAPSGGFRINSIDAPRRVGSNTFQITAADTAISFGRYGISDVQIDSVSVREVVPIWVSDRNSVNASAWGDSMTAAPSFTSTLFSHFRGVSVYNGGVSGETSTQIKDRMVAASGKFADVVTIWAGRNNRTDPTTIKADIAAMVGVLSTAKFVVISVLNGDNAVEYSGQAQHILITQLNSDLAATYPDNYIDLRSYLVTQYNPSNPQDVTDFERDIVPSSLRYDDQHLNVTGNHLAAGYIAEWISVKGWLGETSHIQSSQVTRTCKGGRLKYAAAYLGYKSNTAAATNYTRPTANVLRSNNFGLWGRCVPSATGQATVDLWSARSDASNLLEVYMNATQVRFYKVVAGAFAGPVATYTHTTGVAFEFQSYQSISGMGIRVKEDGGEWSAWAETTDATSILDAVIPANYQIGAMNDANHFDGNIPFIAIVKHGDPKRELERLGLMYP